MPFFVLTVAFFQKYDKKAGIGTVFPTMLPYSLGFLLGWIVLLIVWYVLGLPLGPGSSHVLPRLIPSAGFVRSRARPLRAALSVPHPIHAGHSPAKRRIFPCFPKKTESRSSREKGLDGAIVSSRKISIMLTGFAGHQHTVSRQAGFSIAVVRRPGGCAHPADHHGL